MMRFGASTVVLSPEGWEDQVHTLADAGMEVVELCAAFGPHSRADIATFDYTDPYAIERAGAALREAGLALHSIHGPVGTAEPVLVEPLLTTLFACIDACAALGGRFVTTQDAVGERGPEPDVPYLASPACLARLADYAADHACVFALENGAEDADGFRRIVDTVRGLGHAGLGICLDLGHAQVWNHRDVPRAVREAGPLIRTCHVHDNLGMSDDHLPPGDGVIPWAAVLGELERAGYRGPLVTELHSGGQYALGRSREFLGTVTGPYWRPAAAGGEYEVFPATEADRTRARSVFGEGVTASPGRAAVAVDRFGDVVGWCEKSVAGAEEGKLRHIFAPGVINSAAKPEDRVAIERAWRELLGEPGERR